MRTSPRIPIPALAPELNRRDGIRLGLLALTLLGGAGALTACGDDTPARPSADAPTELDGIELVSSEVERAPGDPTVLAEVVAGLRRLAGGLYGGIAAQPGNLVLSPYSVLLALGMTLTGAAGTTAQEMRAVLGAEDLRERWHKGVNALTAHVDGLAGTQVRADGSEAELSLAGANQLFGQRDVDWEPEFLDLLAKEYGAGLRAVDFIAGAEAVRALINAWVEEQTAGRIVDLVPQDALDASTRLALVNAVHLKAPWEHPFDHQLTATGPFRSPGDASVEVDLMRAPAVAGALVVGPRWRAAVLPYAGRRLAMTVILPDEGALQPVEAAMIGDGFAGALAEGVPATLDVTLPKWTSRTAASLKGPLERLGMPSAFGAADFTPMTTEDLDLVVDDVLHQGFIAVDEEGTEAAAATSVEMAETSAPIAESFVVDRPFLFVIHDREHGTPLFVGRVVDPTS